MKKVLTILMALTLCLGLLAIPAFAAEAVPYVEYTWDEATSTLSSETKSVTEYTEITSETIQWSDGGWYVAKGNVTIDERVVVSGSVNLILTDGCTLSTKGITVEKGTTLTIYGQSQGSGALSALATGNFDAGIGGGYPGKHCGTVVIHGGVVTAKSRFDAPAAGIGGAGVGGGTLYQAGKGGTVTIYSGTVTAVGGYKESTTMAAGAGIGGGGGTYQRITYSGAGGTVKIYGGIVNATGGRARDFYYGSGIGGGGTRGRTGGNGGDVTIAGGIVNAIGYESGIGRGYYGSDGSGTLNATNCIINGTVYGSFTLPEDYTVAEGASFTVPAGATLTIPAGVTLTVNGTAKNDGTMVNNGTLTLLTKDKLSGSGTVTGTGTNQILTVTAEQITVPTTLVYNGEDQIAAAQNAMSISTNPETICGATFAFASSWSFDSISPATVKDAGTYTVTYTDGTSTVSKDFAVAAKTIQNAVVGVFDSLTYDGSSQVPVAEVTVDGLSVTGSWDPVRNVTDKAIFVANGNFTGTLEKETSMKPKAVTAVVTAQDKYWDYSDEAEFSITAETGIAGETLSIMGISAFFQDMEIGEGKTVILRKAFMEIFCSNGKAENYNVTVPDTATASIKAIPLTIAGITMDASGYTYGDVVGYDSTALTIAQPGGAVAKAKDLVYTYTGTANDASSWNSATAPTKAGTYTLTISHKDTEHYLGSQSVSFTIEKASVTITAKNQSYLIGTKPPEIAESELGKHYTIHGLLGEDNIGTITMKYQQNGMDVTVDSVSGECDIIVAVTNPNPNYEISFVHGKLTHYYIPTYTPTVSETEGGDVAIDNKYPSQGQTVTITPKPKEGMVVDTVTVTDQLGSQIAVTENSDGTYSFQQPFESAMIKVTFKTEARPSEAYSDLDVNAWYHDAVDYVLRKGMMDGVGGNKFAPEETTSRAMLVTILWRLEGEPVVNYAMNFSDVAEDEWYTEAIRWATSEKIVEGYGDGKFGTTDSLTREQLATILYRYEQYKGGGFKGMWAFLPSYADRAEASDWAYEAVCWMDMNDIITGKPGNLLDPKGSASRAQLAVILQRYCEK
ncbi:MAG: S-layer homology domain-containing protein [Oscillospiraceae bacterium]|nr:S-layer homology domain-containing protein [Oscillospiraceae bacterium]